MYTIFSNARRLPLTIIDEVAKKLPLGRHYKLLHDYADHPMYINALSNSIRAQMGQTRRAATPCIILCMAYPEAICSRMEIHTPSLWNDKPTRCEELRVGAITKDHVYQCSIWREEWGWALCRCHIESFCHLWALKKITYIRPCFFNWLLETLEEVNIRTGWDDFKNKVVWPFFDYIPRKPTRQTKFAAVYKFW